MLSDDEIDAAISALSGCDAAGKSDREAEAYLREARATQGETRIAALEAVFLTAKKEPRERVCTKASRR